MNTTPRNLLEVFSAGYFITNTKLRITESYDDRARVSPTLYDELQVEGGPVVVKIDQTHWEVEPAVDVMQDTVEVPVDTFDYEDNIFVARPGNAEQILGW